MNNQYNNYNNWNQMPYVPPINNNNNNNYNNNNDDDSNKGGGVLSFLIAVILLICAVSILLHLLGIIDLQELYNKYIAKEETKEVLDDKGQTEDTNNNQPKDTITDDTKKELDNYCTKVNVTGDYYEEENNNVICTDNICIIIKENQYFAKNCLTNEYKVSSTDEFTEASKKNIIFKTLCSNLDADGNFQAQDKNGENIYSCANFVCTAKINGQDYTKTCQQN